METENRVRLADIFIAIPDPRQAGTKHMTCSEDAGGGGVPAGADRFVETEMWARQKLHWFRCCRSHGLRQH